jgi:hypothetical protein
MTTRLQEGFKLSGAVMAHANLDELWTDFVMENAPKLGKALANTIVANLAGGTFAPGLVAPAPEGIEAPSSKPTMPKRPGSAQANNEKILAAIETEGSSLQQIVDKTQLPKNYVRSRLNRVIRDAGTARTEGKTTKTRYFRK